MSHMSSKSRLELWSRSMLGLEALVALAFVATVAIFEREHKVPLALYGAFYLVALVSTVLGFKAYRLSRNAWLLLLPAASLLMVPCVWVVAVFYFFRFVPE